MKQVWSLLCEREIEIALVARQHHPGRKGEKHHLVRIPCERARILQAIERPRGLRGKQSARSVCAVDVKPDATLGADRADGLEIVERASCRCACGSHDR